MGYKIKKLYNYRKDRPVRIDDVKKSRFDNKKIVEANGNKYRIWSYEDELIDDSHVHDKVLWEGDLDDCPIHLFDNVGSRNIKKIPKITDRLNREFGEGRFLIMHYLGYKRIGCDYKYFVEEVEH